MKLLKPESCQWESGGGNVNTLTALGDAFADISSDRGSIQKSRLAEQSASENPA
jgi:hypothetical protein